VRIKRKSRKGQLKRPKKRRRIPQSAIKKANRQRKRSNIELLVHNWLEEDKIPYKKERAIGRCHVDVFLEPNLCIELNGCYWHGCLICNKKPTDKQKIAQIKDARRYAYFRNRGYDVVVFWECEILKYKDRVRDQLRALVRKEDV
jgi:G:T-mismatch repair DNA endonuclease (very short patch repair protein)